MLMTLILRQGYRYHKIRQAFSKIYRRHFDTVSKYNVGWSGGAMVLSYPTIWITVGQGPTALAVGAGGGCLDILLSPILSFLFLPLSGRRSDID